MKIIQRTRREVYQRWISALRSGKYKQTQGRLKETYLGEYFCCLGVLCDLAHKDGGPAWDDANFFISEYAFLPSVIQKWMKLTAKDETKLADLNDHEDLNFKEIADYIESKILPKIKD